MIKIAREMIAVVIMFLYRVVTKVRERFQVGRYDGENV